MLYLNLHITYNITFITHSDLSEKPRRRNKDVNHLVANRMVFIIFIIFIPLYTTSNCSHNLWHNSITKGYIKCIGFCSEIFTNYHGRTDECERFQSCYSHCRWGGENSSLYHKLLFIKFMNTFVLKIQGIHIRILCIF